MIDGVCRQCRREIRLISSLFEQNGPFCECTFGGGVVDDRVKEFYADPIKYIDKRIAEFCGVAQSAERVPVKHDAGGSSPPVTAKDAP